MVTLPQVHTDNVHMRVVDGKALRVQALRHVEASGGRFCLPSEATLSSDGRAEVLELLIPVPPGVDAKSVSAKRSREGLLLLAPRRAETYKTQGHETQDKKSSQVGDDNHDARGVLAPSAIPANLRSSAVEQRNVGMKSDRAPASSAGRFRQLPTQGQVLELPSSDGIEVDDAEWLEVEKDEDAASGWWDNRGDFHEYGD
jgi:hypothetical protein